MTGATQVLDAPHRQEVGLLRLPEPDGRFLSGDCGSHSPLGWAQAPDGDQGGLARYRWRVGHQATFCVWRLLSECLTRLAQDGRPSQGLTRRATALYDAYSALLVYAGSCSPEVYGHAIRPVMAEADPAFSGRWARDYEDIPSVFRRVRAAHPPDAVAGLNEARKANQVVHMAVAKRLVDDGPSLLRRYGATNTVVTDRQRDVFDAFFRVVRADICQQAFTMQLVGLFTAILDDCARSPLAVPHVWADHPVLAKYHTDAEPILWRLIDLALNERTIP